MIVTLDEKRRLTVPVALAPTTPGNDRDFRRPGVKVFNPFKELS